MMILKGAKNRQRCGEYDSPPIMHVIKPIMPTDSNENVHARIGTASDRKYAYG